MSKGNYKKKERLNQIKTEFGLEEIGANFFDPGGQTNLIQSITHQSMINSLSRGEVVNALNVLEVGCRIQESLINDQFTNEDQEYLLVLKEETEDLETNDMSGRFNKAFEAYDFVVRGLNRSLKEFEYQAKETNHGGILSTLIGNRISEYDQNWIQGIHGGVRAGKTRCAGRLGTNINRVVERNLGTKVGFSVKDWVFTKQQYIDRLRERRAEGTLKGSIIVLEEAGDMLNSQRFWDEDVVGAVNILRQQGYQNTCLLIISQLHKDVVNKARGLMHAVMVPWKDYRSRPLELDRVSSIDFAKQMSNWKIDTLDVNPMDGGTYPQGIKVALGKVKKLSVLMPPKALDTLIGARDIKHKENKMDEEYYKTIKSNLTAGDKGTLTKCAKEILAEVDKYKNASGTWKTSRIGSKWGLGGRLAVKVRDQCIEMLEKEEKAKGSVTQPGRETTSSEKATNGEGGGSNPPTAKETEVKQDG